MSCPLHGRLAVLVLVALTGCGVVNPRRDAVPKAPLASKGKDPMSQLALGPGSTREPRLADPAPPPPPSLFPDIPPAPGKDDGVAAVPTPKPETGNEVAAASGIVAPEAAADRGSPPEQVRAKAEQPAGSESNLDALRRIHRRAADRFNALDGFDCRLTRRESVGDKPMPQEELEYRYRREPLSLHIKWVGKEAQGRELIYVAGKYDGKVQILTGRSEGLFIPAGKRFAFAPTDSSVRSKSRYDIREGGMGLGIQWFGKVLAEMERDPGQASRLRFLGPTPTRERETGLEAVEETIPPNWEPLLPKGGRRTIHFDADPASPSFGLPIRVVTLGDDGRQVEYYWFENLRPTHPTDADFDPDRLWKK